MRQPELSPLLFTTKPVWFDDFEGTDPAEQIDPSLEETLLYMARVEDQTAAYSLFSVLNPKFLYDVNYAGELATWAQQEWWHGQQLWQILGRLNPDYSRTKDRISQVSSISRWQKFKQRLMAEVLPWALTREVMAGVVAVKGFFNEATTRAGYNLLRELADHSHLQPLKNIADEESLHAANYRKRAEEILDGSKTAQKIARFALEKVPMIVGEDYRRSAEADRVIRTLFKNSRADGVAESVDTVLATLPGMKGVRILQNRVDAALSA